MKSVETDRGVSPTVIKKRFQNMKITHGIERVFKGSHQDSRGNEKNVFQEQRLDGENRHTQQRT